MSHQVSLPTLAELGEALVEMAGQVAAIRQIQEKQARVLADLGSLPESVEEIVGRNESSLAALQAEVTGLQGRVQALEFDVEGLEERVNSLAQELAAVTGKPSVPGETAEPTLGEEGEESPSRPWLDDFMQGLGLS